MQGPVTLVALATMFGLGAIHALGADHCAAVAALASRRPGLSPALRLGLRFGLGHAAALGCAALGVAALGWTISEALGRLLEVAGGLTLAALGAFTAREAARGLVLHRHAHAHEDRAAGGARAEYRSEAPSRDAHAHWHLHWPGDDVRDHDHGHGRLPLVAGAVLGLAGVRGLVVALPAVVSGSLGSAALQVALFGAGVVCAMTLVGMAAGPVFARARAFRARAQLCAGLAAAGMGAVWAAAHALG